MQNICSELLDLIESKAPFTDILMSQDQPVMVKMPDGWKPVVDFLPPGPDEIAEIMTSIDVDWEENIKKGAINRPLHLSSWRLRINAFLADAGTRTTLSIRRIHSTPLSIAQTGLPASVRMMIECPRGLILVSGATGSGKSTTIASLVDSINEVRNAHVVTVEDPIEYIYQRKKSIFSQREVGVDVSSYFEGVKDAMRQRPDVIVIGEIRDKETAEAALFAGESGHLVIGSLHANTGVGTITKMLSFFNSQEVESKRQTLIGSMVGIINQILLPEASGNGYVLASELLFNHKGQYGDAIGNPDKLAAMIERKEVDISQPMSDAMVSLVKNEKIKKADAIRATWHAQNALYERLKTL